MVNSQIYYVLFCAVVFGSAQCLNLNKCSQGGLVPDEVTIDGCEPDVDICSVKFNGLLSMTMKFKAPHYLEHMKPKMFVKSAFTKVEVKGVASNDDVCKGILNTICPLVEKESIEYKYSTKLAVLPWIPLTLEFSILDTTLDETAICFTVNVDPSKF